MPVIIVTSVEQVEALANAIRDPARADEAIVALTSRVGRAEPTLLPSEVDERLGYARSVYAIRSGPLTRALESLLPPRFGVYNGSARVWWPPVDDRSDPRQHP